ncbi:hypothetical protein QFZ60_000831 [Arthrobacter sp. B2I5]|uniref:glycosyl hydrolase family 28-related protein n=1 Tax=Arthrobacter sp. B2I5 TaxID=3042266 RepID=UPI00277D73DE|nr:glycosyl hydrolase family 28-related protein [Arthrobacter sp. B2I5]MDQ0824658.1 hypothetical protein [Arthrobacter sp. B2I5]
MTKNDDERVRRRELFRVGALASVVTGTSVLAGVGISQSTSPDTKHDTKAPTLGNAQDFAIRNVKDFGAVGDGTAVDTNAVQAAIAAGGITYFPPGTYEVSDLVAADGMRLVGVGTAGLGRSRLRSKTGTIFRTSGPATFSTKVSGLVFDSFGGGGDLFTGMWSLGMFEDCAFVQYQDGSSCFNVTGWIDMLVIRCTFDHTHSATVPTFKAVSDTGELAQSTFLSNRFTKTGDYAIHLEGTDGSVVENFSIRDTNFEESEGGAVRLLSTRNTSINNPGVWDFKQGDATKHLMYIGTSAKNGVVSSNNEISHYVRDAMCKLGPGVYDIALGAGTEFTSIMHPRHQLTAAVQVNMSGTTGLVVGDNPLVSGGTQATIISGQAVKFPQTPTSQRPAASAAGAGSQIFDSTINAFVYSDGTTWRKISDDSPA